VDRYTVAALIALVLPVLLFVVVMSWPSIQTWHRCEQAKSIYREARRDGVATWDMAYDYQTACYR
jgi:hypothetical protein